MILYEEFKIKEYWHVCLNEQSLTQYILNDKGKYEGKLPLTSGDKAITPLVPGFELNIDDVFHGFELKYYYSQYQKISHQ